jgi:hypothetical protein
MYSTSSAAVECEWVGAWMLSFLELFSLSWHFGFWDLQHFILQKCKDFLGVEGVEGLKNRTREYDSYFFFVFWDLLLLCVCVCVCVCERERERKRAHQHFGGTCFPSVHHSSALKMGADALLHLTELWSYFPLLWDPNFWRCLFLPAMHRIIQQVLMLLWTWLVVQVLLFIVTTSKLISVFSTVTLN